jgi:hypothetical protein
MGQSDIFCEQCGHFYCSKCSQLRHLKRQDHRFLTQKPESGEHQKEEVSIHRLSNEDESQTGLFAIAFAISLAYGDLPQTQLYIQSKMRKHLVDCLDRH